MKIKFIINPTSGSCAGLKLGRELAELGDVSCTTVAGRNCAFELAKEAVIAGFDRIVAVGGDGTVHEVINGMASAGGLSIYLGIIPMGAGNDFARNLGIPKNPKKALAVALGDCAIKIDLGRANDRYFANVISFGFDVKVASLASDLKRNHGFLPKDLTYLLAALKESIFSGLGEYPIVARTSESRLAGQAAFLVIANGQNYGGIFKIAPDADLGDGLLNLCWIKPMSRIKVFAKIHRLIQGTHETLPEARTLKAESFIVSSVVPLICEMDGEILEPKPEYRISVIPKALNVLVSGPELQS